MTFFAGFSAPGAVSVPARVIVIPVEREVDYGLYAFLKRATAEARAAKPDYIVYKVNTYGGELQAAFEIVDLLQAVKECSTYVYVEQRAISAGALISLACNRIAMGNGTTLGDCAPIAQSREGGLIMLGEKIQSPLRAKFRGLAERNGYPVLLSQTMVTPGLGAVRARPADASRPAEYFTVKQWAGLSPERRARFHDPSLVVREGELLTLTDREAALYGFSQGSFSGFDAFLKQNRWTVIRTIEPSWSEVLARWVGKIAPLLMLAGFALLYLEFKAPGLSLFGVLGGLCLAAAFGSKYAVGLADHTELLLLLAGFALFLVEIYVVPGTFIAGGIGLVLLIAALTLSLQGFGVPDPSLPWQLHSLVDNLALTLGTAALALLAPLLAIRYGLPLLSKKGGVVSGVTLRDARSAAADVPDLAEGAHGEALTPLRPAGKGVFGGVVFEVSSRGEFLDAGTPVEVFRIHGRGILVRARGAA